MIRVRVSCLLGNAATSTVTAEGVTLAAAVRSAQRQLGIGSGRTTARERTGPHTWRWTWTTPTCAHVLDVMELRPSGPNIARSERRRRKLEISLGDEARARLDALAVGVDGGRSGVVERWLLTAEDNVRHVPHSQRRH